MSQARAVIRERFPETPDPLTLGASSKAPPDFPLELLAGYGPASTDGRPDPKTWMRDFVAAVGDSLQTGAGMPALLSLSTLAAAVQDKLQVKRADWLEPVCLYTLSYAPPGSRKSQAFRKCTGPLNEMEHDIAQESIQQWAKGTARLHAARARHKSITLRIAKAKSREQRDQLQQELEEIQVEIDSAPEQFPRRWLVDDITTEALGRVCAQQGGTIACFAPEADILDIFSGRYSDGKANLRLLKSGYSGEPYRSDRIGRVRDSIERCCITLALTTQPDVLKGLGSRQGFEGQGVLDRIDYCQVPDLVGRRKTGEDCPTIPTTVRGRYHEGVKRLLRLGAPRYRFEIPNSIELDAEALGESYVVEQDFEERLGRDGEWRAVGLVQYGSKMLGRVLRYAALLHLIGRIDEPDPLAGKITLRELLRGRNIVEQFTIPQALVAFDLMRETPHQSAAEELREWVEEKRLRTWEHRDALQALHRRRAFRRAEDLKAAETALVRAGFIREGTLENGDGLRRVFVSHPDLCGRSDHYVEDGERLPQAEAL